MLGWVSAEEIRLLLINRKLNWKPRKGAGRPRIPEEFKKKYIPTGIRRGPKLGSKKKKLKPKPVPPPKPAPREKPLVYEDRMVVDEKYRPTEFTLPVWIMSDTEYNNELSDRQLTSSNLGFNSFLQTKSMAGLKLALSRDGSPKAIKFLKALVNPKNKDLDIAVIAERNGIGFNDLMAVWRNDKLAEAMGVLFNSAPVIAEHTAKDAESTISCCPRCDGAGMMKINREEVFSWVECISCGGTGGIRKLGDRPSRRFVFEAVGISKQSAPTVNVNNNISLASMDSVLEEMERIIDVTPQPQAIEEPE